MFSWISLASSVMKFFSSLVGLLRDGKLRDAGRNEVKLDAAIRTLEDIAHAKKIRNSKSILSDDKRMLRKPANRDKR